MIKLIYLLSTLLLSTSTLSADPLISIGPDQLQTLQQQHALVIDIRTEPEWQSSGLIPGSHKLQAFDSEGQLDQQAWVSQLQQLRSDANQPVVLVCRSGKRSEKLGQILTQQLGMQQIYHLSNGIQGWTQTGHSLINNCSANAC